MKNLRQAILYYAYTYQGDWQKIAFAIKNKEAYRNINCPYSFITIADDTYPDAFKRLRYPPWILFYEGKIENIHHPCIGIVGSRNCTPKALENTRIVVNHVKKKYCIVSGLAKGIDAMSHQCSLDAKTIGILGCGINRIYPKENTKLFENMRKSQLIVSEYPPGTPPLRHHFPWRNRLIAALSQSLIVIEAQYKSGTMITVSSCIELSVPVYCLSTAFGQNDYLGCNYLIQNGANIIVEEDDLEDI